MRETTSETESQTIENSDHDLFATKKDLKILKLKLQHEAGILIYARWSANLGIRVQAKEFSMHTDNDAP